MTRWPRCKRKWTGVADAAPLWSRDAFARAVGGTLAGTFESPVTGISIDTRTLASGDAFFAIQGDNFDGHGFAETAIEMGASIAVCRTGHFSAEAGPVPRLDVEDVLRGLEYLGRAARARCKGRVIGVTGSVGKTSTKDILRVAFEPSGTVHASAASYNNHWGVPLSLSRFREDVATGIFEIGMNHPGEITPLSRMVRPDVAIITTVEAVHMEAFNSVEEIAAAKAEIFDGLQSGGVAILNRDNPHFAYLAGRAQAAGAGQVIGFGSHKAADVRVQDSYLKADCSVVKANILGTDLVYKIGTPGQHIVMNSLAVLAAVKIAGEDVAAAALALAGWSPPKGRGSRREFPLGGGMLTLIDESYNANPASMRAAIATLGQAKPGPGGRRIAVLGDMLELGDQSRAMHAGLQAMIAESGVDIVFTAGPHMETLYDALPAELRGGHEADAASLAANLPGKLGSGDVVMIKGSNGSRMMDVVAAIEVWLGSG
jgi:UDP-N-acetylmuramoyl-tripeptide--D-alanyl-D-alanine ligase